MNDESKVHRKEKREGEIELSHKGRDKALTQKER